mgnify:CR=1 FL=1
MEVLMLALAPVFAKLAMTLGEDATEMITAFIVGFARLRAARQEKALLLPQLIKWWCIAADEQRNPDGSLLSKEEKHAYVKGIIEVWAKGLSLDLVTSFTDALIKSEMLRRQEAAGIEMVKDMTAE